MRNGGKAWGGGVEGEKQSYVLSINFCAEEVCETKLALNWKPLTQGQILPEKLVVIVCGRK